MNLIDRAFFLKKTSLFNELTLDLLLAIADKMTERHWETGEVIFEEGENAHQMYFVVTGEVALDHSIQLGPTNYFGDESLFNDKARGYRAAASAQTMTLLLSRTHLLAIINECPAVAIRLLEAYSQTVSLRV